MKVRPRIKFLVVCCAVLLGLASALIYGIATETQKGQAADLEQLRDAAARLPSMAAFARTSKIWSFPYDYPVEWICMKSRPQFQCHGKGVVNKIEPFLSGLGTPVFRHVNENGERTKATFIFSEGDISAEGELDLTNGSFLFRVIHLRSAEQDSPANGSQPVRAETNQASSTAGSRR